MPYQRTLLLIIQSNMSPRPFLSDEVDLGNKKGKRNGFLQLSDAIKWKAKLVKEIFIFKVGYILLYFMLILPFVNIHQNNSKAGDQQNNFCTVMPQRFETPLNQKEAAEIILQTNRPFQDFIKISITRFSLPLQIYSILVTKS